MLREFRLGAVALAFAIASGCFAAEKMEFKTVSDASPRNDPRGVGVTPPQGPSWGERLEPGRFLYVKLERNSKTHSFFASAFLMPVSGSYPSPEEFLKFALAKKEANPTPDRMRNAKVRCELDKLYGSYCVRYSMNHEDWGAKNAGGSSFLLIRTEGYVFLHPFDPSLAVDVSWSERGLQKDFNKKWQEEGEAFIRGLRISAPAKAEAAETAPAKN